MRKDTIAAISTAMTNSGIGIVRISGEEAFDIIKRIYKGKKDKDLSKVKSHTIHYGYIMDGKETIDEVLIMIMREMNILSIDEIEKEYYVFKLTNNVKTDLDKSNILRKLKSQQRKGL